MKISPQSMPQLFDNLQRKSTAASPHFNITSPQVVTESSSVKASSAGRQVAENVKFSQELIERGFTQVEKSMLSTRVRGGAVAAAIDFYKNLPEIGMLVANAGPKKGTASVSLELSSIRRDTITMMNSLPPEINIQVADEIKTQISNNEWPTDVTSIHSRIKAISEAIASDSLKSNRK